MKTTPSTAPVPTPCATAPAPFPELDVAAAVEPLRVASVAVVVVIVVLGLDEFLAAVAELTVLLMPAAAVDMAESTALVMLLPTPEKSSRPLLAAAVA